MRTRKRFLAGILASLFVIGLFVFTTSAQLPDGQGAATNIGLDASTLEIEGNLIAFIVTESSEGGTDLNGDGDTDDGVLHVFDASIGVTTNVGLASSIDFQIEGNLVAFTVSESSQGGTDLNGDGDDNDVVLHVFDASTSVTTNVGLATSSSIFVTFNIEGSLVAFGVSELDQGSTDLNGDGDASDRVLHVFDASTDVTTNVGLAVTFVSQSAIDGNLVVFIVPELDQGGTDLNGDGDAGDLVLGVPGDFVLHVFDASTGVTTNVGLATTNVGDLDFRSFDLGLRSFDFRFEGNFVAFTVYESNQGSTDLNGDGDVDDFVLHVFDASTGITTNVGLATFLSTVQTHRLFSLEGSLVAFGVPESDQGRTDLDGDGLVDSTILHVFDASTGVTTNLGLGLDASGDGFQIEGNLVAFTSASVLHVFDASTGFTTNVGLDAFGFGIEGNLVAFGVRESEQGGTDLNGDGDAVDRVLHVFDASTGVATNLGLAVRELRIDGDLVAFLVPESGFSGEGQGSMDLNGDGDAADFVLHVLNAATGVTTNVGLAVGLRTFDFRIDGNVVAFAVPEGSQGGTDLNGDGRVASGAVLHVFDGSTGITTNVGLAAEGFQIDGNLVAFRVPESGFFGEGQGRTDLNGDGDASDFVLHVFSIVQITDATPQLLLPGDLTAEAIGPTGAVVTYSAAASGLAGGAIVAFCSPASGSTFPLGTTLVNCTATDAAGSTATGSFNVTVIDTTPPSLTVPADIRVGGAEPTGAVVTYVASATDLVDGAIVPLCSPASGSTFPLGTTPVNCTATDAAGNTATAGFKVTVFGTPPHTTNVGLRVNRFQIDGNLVAFTVTEIEGGTDLNGDGDAAFDAVLHVLDASTGVTTNLGLAASSDFQIGGNFAVFTVPESSQGGTDLNGDGDANDFALHVFDAATGVTTNVGLSTGSVGSLQIDGSLVAFTVSEVAQGRTDLNGDGDAFDQVLHVFDASTGLTTNVGLDVVALQIDGKLVAFTVPESDQGATDLNGDGDADDSVLHVFDASTGLTTNVGLATFDDFRNDFQDGSLVVFRVFESAQGGTDLNGDGDADDRVLHVLDARTGITTNVGLATPVSAHFEIDGGLVAFTVSESAQESTDLNGDGDADDSVLHLLDASSGATTNVGLAIITIGFGDDFFQIDGGLVAFTVREFAQGDTDLNGDGDAFDRVLHVFDASTGVTTNVGVAVFRLQIDGTLVAFTVPEVSQGGVDLNGDGDAFDPFSTLGDIVLHVFDAATGVATNVGLAVSVFGSPNFQIDGSVVAFGVSESAQGGTDLNGDGDADADFILHLFDAATGLTTNVGLAIHSFQIEGNLVAFLVSEAAQNADFNGDGFIGSFILHVFSVPQAADTIPPELFLPGDFTAEATGPTGAGVTYSVSATDLVDGAVTPACSPASGSIFALGTTAVICSATDAAGNTATGGFNVTVVDTTAPTLTLPPDLTEEATTVAGAAVAYSASATDLVDGAIVPTCSPSSGSTFPVGTTPVSCSASDGAGNTATGSFNVTVVDTTAPTLTLPPDLTEEATGPAGAAVTYSASATDLVDGAIAPTCTPASGSIFSLGTTPVSCSASDGAGNTATGSFNVTVVDTTPPTLTLPADLAAEATGPTGAAVTYSASASDLVDGAITPVCSPASGSTFPLGTTPVSCTATDAAGNTGTGSFNVTVVDTTPPTLTLPADLAAEATGPTGAAVTYSASASDLVDGAITPACSRASGSVFPLGTTPVSCTATDAAGNTAAGSFNVTVVDTTPPETAITSAADGNGFAVPDGGVTNSTSISFTLVGLDAVGVAGFECSLDGAPFAACTSSHSLTGLGIGTHAFAVRAVDTSGNVDPTSDSLSWEILAIDLPPDIDGTVTTDEEGNTVITGTDESGETVVEIVLPPGTEVPSGALELELTSRGVNNAAELTGVSVPYPPGKSITIGSNPGANFACIVDGPESILVKGLPNCGATDTSISQVRMACDGTTQMFTGFPNEPLERQYTCTTFADGGKTFMRIDGLAFSFVLDFDACPASPGPIERQGCPVADENRVELHIVDQAKSGTCPNGAGSCKLPAAGAEVRVYDRNELDGLTITTLDSAATTLTKNPDGSLYDDIYESPEANASALAASLGCVTDANGFCIAGEEAMGEYLVIVRFVDESSGKTVYTGKPKGPEDFADTDGDGAGDLASKDFQILQVIKRDGSVQFGGGSKTVVTGSYLEVVSPDFATWEDAAAGYVYPFVFTSDSDWDVDVCAQVPTGYEITGVYDEQGVLVSTTSCAQTFVSGETKAIAFDVEEVGSPEPRLRAQLRVRRRGPRGKTRILGLDVPGTRRYLERARHNGK